MSAPVWCVGCDAFVDPVHLLDDSMVDGLIVKCDECEPLADDREAA